MAMHIIGNWKQSGNFTLLDDFSKYTWPKSIQWGLCVPYPYLAYASQLGFMNIGAQDCSAFEKGPYTSQVGANHIQEAGAQFTLIGHSETRQYLGVTDQHVYKKIQQAKKNNLKAIVCLGENEEDYKKGLTLAVITHQIQSLMPFEGDLIAYEPIWAIGTGLHATSGHIQMVCEHIQSHTHTNVLYGGSVNRDNITDILSIPSISGVLVGGASLDKDHFYDLGQKAQSIPKNCV